MNLPRIYERVYCEPVCILPARFQAIHTVLLPHLSGSRPLPLAGAAEEPRAEIRAAGLTNSRGQRFQRIAAGERGRLFNLAGSAAVIPVYGVLAKNISAFEESCGGGTDINPIAAALEQAVAAKEVKTIVFDFSSPGGAVTGIAEIGVAIAAAAQVKPTYAFSDSQMCSAAYWLGSQCAEIYVAPSAIIGSIGVYLAWLDETVALQLQGLRLEYFGAGEHKAAGLPGKPLTNAQRGLLQARVDEIYKDFTGAVSAKRPEISPATMQGQVFSGKKALAAGLVDGLVNDFREFAELLGFDK